MKLSEVNFSNKSLEKMGNIKNSPSLPRQKMLSSDSFINTKSAPNEEKQNFIQKAFNKLKSIFLFSKKEVNSSNENKALDLDTSKVTNNSFVSFKAKKETVSKTQFDIEIAKAKLFEQVGFSEVEASSLLEQLKKRNPDISYEKIISMLEQNNISIDDFAKVCKSEYSECGDNKTAFKSALLTLNNYRRIVENELFTPFNLNFEDVHSIHTNVQTGTLDEIMILLYEKDEKIFDLFEEKNVLDDYEKDLNNQIYNLVSDLANSYVYENSDAVQRIVINGEEKTILFPQSKDITPKTYPKSSVGEYIESNLITKEIIDNLPENYKANKTGFGTIHIDKFPANISIELDIDNLIEKVRTKGINKLTSQEIHVLTDFFASNYGENTWITTAVQNAMKTVAPIQKEIDKLKTIADRVIKPNDNVKFRDHAFMRMLDRNIVTIANNKENRMYKEEEFMSLLIEKAKEAAKKGDKEFYIYGKNDKQVVEKNNGSNVRVLIKNVFDKTLKKEIILIDTIISQ